jgi:hypothetical protein
VSNAIEDARRALDEARSALNSVEVDIHNRRSAALAAINAEMAPARAAAQMSVDAALARLKAALDTTPDHPWTGRLVYSMQYSGHVWERRKKRVEGVVETMRSKTVLPKNTSDWRRPDIGAPFVRLLKKDGTLGAKFDTWGMDGDWKLVDEPKTIPITTSEDEK